MNRNELLKRLMNKPVKFTVDGYGDYFVKGMNTMDYLFAAAQSETDEHGNMNQESYFAALVVRCVLDENKQRLFKDEDMQILKEADISFVLPLALKVQELSNLSTGEDLKKN
ncbi:hypothetical protein [Vibrio cholerae]|uniref:Uncharacterized protein n=2 Tax=Vibrio cholerae TaxID=666 RepID=A0A655TCW7_VIBCL|nr:hypothetical protein [Vibrio cholerae]AFC58285.1 hypothetical protein O3Y_07035 [Vibrio cholerae IEC224]AUR69704.1 hypothetical protein C1H56_06290 [Vibrio cholerae]AVL22666.1 hypothetical protein VCA1552_01243 [Vibrio cholerae]AWB73987.1 hypothetical protein A1552VC_01245 [Vibrio cholerae]EHU0373398.1 hypothetical protein [Vibrio cholerae]